MKKNTKVIIPILLGILVIGIIVGIVLYKKFSPSKEIMKLTDYFKVGKGEVEIILGDQICDAKGIVKDNKVYVEYEFVRDFLNQRFYWDKNENLLLYTTPSAVISAEAGSKNAFKNNSRMAKDYEMVKAEGEKVYVALDYVKEHTALTYKVYSNPKRIVLTNEFGVAKEYSKALSDMKLRYKASIKSPILKQVKEKETLRLLQKEDKDTGFCKVMDKSGIIGYVKADDLDKTYTRSENIDFSQEEYTHILRDHKINLVWHQVTNQTANGKLMNLLSTTKGVNVVCPTWFAISDNKGSIDSLASDGYVEQAHRQGVEVWGLCNDFSPNMKIGKVLGTTSRRQKLAKNLIAEAIRYSLDGINIDFENVKKESGQDFIQFIRELGIMCRNNGIVLSIDNYPVRAYNKFYNRKEQAAVADYVITMAYDEYYSGSEEAGPVSSLSYVQDSTEGVLKEVPAKQAVIALPFYSRHWKEKTKNGTVKLTSEACSMKYAQEIVDDSKKQATWDETAGMNYLEYTKGNTVHKMWIEDINSLQEKMKVVSQSKTAGVAFWKLGMEDKSVWDMIVKYNK